MAYMDLIRGVHTGERVQYPIYDIEIPSGSTIKVATMYSSYVTRDSALSVVYMPNADISSFFPADMPRTVEQDGCICQNDYKYVEAAPNWILKTQAFSAIPIGQEPDDWNTNYFDYYTATTITISGHTCTAMHPTISQTGAVNYNQCPPTFDPLASYYRDELPVKKRTNHIFTTDNFYSFGVNIAPNYMYGYVRGIAHCNPEVAVHTAAMVTALHDVNGGQFTITGTTVDDVAVYQLSMGLLTSIPFLQIFVHFVHEDIDYWGAAQIMMSSTDPATAHPIGIRVFALPLSYWGSSIHGGTPEQGGEWGSPTQRAGGQGSHTASSDSRGDRAGATVRDIMADRNTALSIAFDNPFMRTYTFDNLTNSQIAEIFAILYGTDYWSMFQNQMLNPLSSIIAFHLIPSTLRGENLTLEDLIIGPKNISADMTGTPQVTKIKQVRWYHVGSVDITDVLLPYYDAYPDFAPYTDIILHLPYIGDIKIDVNAVMYGSLAVDYACDNVSGNVAAWIYCEDRYPEPQTHKQYKYIATGNCAYSIPLFAQSQNGMDVGKIIGSGIGIVGGALTGNLAAAVGGAMGIGSALYEHSRAPISTQSTGGSSGNVSILGDTDVWIEVIRSLWIQPESYQDLVGIPSGIAGTLSEIGASGRVVCSDIETDGIAATEPELREIERLLLSGIYLKPNV